MPLATANFGLEVHASGLGSSTGQPNPGLVAIDELDPSNL
jgi:hypothetical protein